MKAGVIDVGSNTVRLLVARQLGNGDLQTLAAERARVGLGEQIERFGMVSEHKLRETADWVSAYARAARREGCDVIDLVITAPGRQSLNANRLVAMLEHAAGLPVRVLPVEEEGRLAYVGALRGVDAAEHLATGVCDVGGGSTEIAVGLGAQPDWLRSYDIGSLRLTCSHFDKAAGRRDIRRARSHVRRVLAGAEQPEVERALAAGGAARAVRKLVGRTLGPGELDEALDLVARTSPAKLAKRYEIDPVRAQTLAAGTVILAEVQALFQVPLVVARGGLREGLAGELLSTVVSSAA